MRLNEIYDRYKDEVRFLSIYIREAHADDGWRSPKNLQEGIVYKEPTTDDERTEVASVCQHMLDLKMPMLIDDIGNTVEEQYIAIPMRLFLIDAGGKLAYVGGEGPMDFKPDEFADAIGAHLNG